MWGLRNRNEALLRRVAGLALALLVGGSRPAEAVRVITDVELDGQDTITIGPGDSFTINANIAVTEAGLNSNNDWQSTGWRISDTPPGSITCDSSVNVNHGPGIIFNDTFAFNVTAPMTPGIYFGFFIAYQDNACAGTGATASNVYRTGAVIVEGCGNGIIEADEICDDGAANGEAGSCCTDSCTTASSCSLTCSNDLAASVTRSGGPSFDDQADLFTITNDAGPGVRITQVTLQLPANVSFDTAGIPLANAPYTQQSGAVETGAISPVNGGVADGTFAVTLTFNDFDPGESFAFSIDTDFDAPLLGISIPTSAQMAGAMVYITFSNGTSTVVGTGTLSDDGGIDNSATIDRSSFGLPCQAPAPAASNDALLVAVIALAGIGARAMRRSTSRV